MWTKSSGAKPADLPVERPTKFELIIQSQEREGSALDDPSVGPAAGGSGDRVIDRRAFIGTLTGGLLVTPHAAWAQQAGKVWRIGFVGTETTSINGHFLAAFRQGMRELGYVEKQTLTVEDRWAEGRSEDFHGLIADLIRLKLDVLVPLSTQGGLAPGSCRVSTGSAAI